MPLPPDIISSVKYNNLKVAQEVLSAEPGSINDIDEKTGQTALHIAVFRGNLPMVRMLLAHPGLDVTKKDRQNRDAVDLAIEVGHNSQVTDELFRFRARQLGLAGARDRPAPTGPQ